MKGLRHVDALVAREAQVHPVAAIVDDRRNEQPVDRREHVQHHEARRAESLLAPDRSPRRDVGDPDDDGHEE